MENDPAGPPPPTYGKFHMFNGFFFESFPNCDVDILRKDVDILVLITQDVDILNKDMDIFKH